MEPNAARLAPGLNQVERGQPAGGCPVLRLAKSGRTFMQDAHSVVPSELVGQSIAFPTLKRWAIIGLSPSGQAAAATLLSYVHGAALFRSI